MARALEMGMPAVAITDHGVLFGLIEFYKQAKARGVKPILGCEIYMARGSRLDRRTEEGKAGSNHLVLLAENEAGYYNLVKLVTAAHLEGFYYKPRIDRELLAKHREGLIGLSSCLKGEIAERLIAGDADGAARLAGEYGDIFGKGNFYLEVQDHGIPEQKKVNCELAALSEKTKLPLVATNDVHYIKKDHAKAHEVLLCLQTQTTMADPNRMRYPTHEFYMKSAEEMARLFGELPQSLENTLKIAERCNVSFRFGEFHFPIFRVPPGQTQESHLMSLAREGLKWRYGVQDADHPKNDKEKEIVERFKYELAVIKQTGFINYYLVVWDFVNFARSHHIPVGPGRGSGAGSLLAYTLGITGIDPLRYGLIFERFLNPERVSPPDFDIDFCQARRGEVIEYVRGKYGTENVAQIITFGSLGAKTVIRDVGRVLGVEYKECDRFAKMVPEDPKMTLELALATNPEFKRTYETDKRCKEILDYGFVLEGLCRNAGTHAAGVVIGEKPLVEIIPLTRDKEKEIITQYSMEPLGDIGLLKMDFLGLRTLTVIQETADLVRATQGVELDMDRLPMDDQPTYDLFKRGDTVGVFQLESSGMRDLIRRVGVDRIEDLIAMIALYRPGPMNMLDEYVNRKTGKAAIAYDHPLLEPVLAETYGVMLYQEQVQRAANVLAGYSLGQGDILRRAMGKKKAQEMKAQRAVFIEGCAKKNKIPHAKAEKIFDTLEKFAGYGFNKSHSAAYAIVAYQTAYLKARYPAEFMAALLSSEIGNTDKLPVFIAEAKEMGLEILPPHVNESEVRFQPLKNGIRFGLAGIKNVGESAAEAIVAERRRGGKYHGLTDFCSRVDGQWANKKVLESLVRCGAFDSLGPHRGFFFGNIDAAMSRAAAVQRDRRVGQGNLFDAAGGQPEKKRDENLPAHAPWTDDQMLVGEKELLGFYLSGHPLTQYAWLLERYQLSNVQRLSSLPAGAVTRVGGIIASFEKKITKKNEEMAVLQLEDLDGNVEVVVFPDTYRQYAAHLQKDRAILLCGEVSKKDDELTLRAVEIYPLEESPMHFTERLSIHIPATNVGDEKLNGLKEILARYPGPVPVVVCLELPSAQKVFLSAADSLRVTPQEKMTLEIERLLGEGSVYVKVNPSACRRSQKSTQKGWQSHRVT